MALEYKTKLQKASFRGVAFGIKDVSTSIGRRSILHEYPLRDDPYAEDLGRKGKEFTISAFVMTPNDFSASQALASALSDYNTPGTLVHPTLGQFQVQVRECTHKYSNQEGGLEYFDVTFVETLGNNFPNVTVDTQSLVRNSVVGLTGTSNAYFATNFKTTGFPDFIANAAIQNLQSFSSQFRGLIDFGSARNGNPDDYSRLIAQLNNFTAQIPTLINDPEQLAELINSLNGTLNDSFADDLALAMLIQARLYQYGIDFLIVNPTTNLRAIEENNQNQLIYLVRTSAVSMMLKNEASMTFASSNDAIATRDSIDNLAFPLLTTLGDNFADDIYTSLTDAVSAMVQDIQTRSANSAPIRTYQIADTLPALVLAYEFLGDASQDDALVQRNNVQNPLFVPANSLVQVVGS